MIPADRERNVLSVVARPAFKDGVKKPYNFLLYGALERLGVPQSLVLPTGIASRGRGIEPAAPAFLVAECRLKPLADPMKMNGCAMVIAGAPAGAAEDLATICGWVAARLGEPGGRSEVWSTAA